VSRQRPPPTQHSVAHSRARRCVAVLVVVVCVCMLMTCDVCVCARAQYRSERRAATRQRLTSAIDQVRQMCMRARSARCACGVLHRVILVTQWRVDQHRKTSVVLAAGADYHNRSCFATISARAIADARRAMSLDAVRRRSCGRDHAHVADVTDRAVVEQALAARTDARARTLGRARLGRACAYAHCHVVVVVGVGVIDCVVARAADIAKRTARVVVGGVGARSEHDDLLEARQTRDVNAAAIAAEGTWSDHDTVDSYRSSYVAAQLQV
jgi:hypothetical protein